MIDHKKLAVIHIVKKELGLSEEAYRDLLYQVCGVRSAKELDDRKFLRLMRAFAASPAYRVNSQGLTFRQLLYIRSLKAQTGWDDAHFTNFLKKYYHVDTIEMLSKPEASKVINALKNIIAHHPH